MWSIGLQALRSSSSSTICRGIGRSCNWACRLYLVQTRQFLLYMAEEQTVVKTRRPGNSAFKQQRLWAFQPVHTFRSTIIIYLVLLAVFICFGLLLLLSALDVKEYSTRYDKAGNCSQTSWNLSQTCSVSLEVEADMPAPVYFYYELHNFYQNHRMYVKSRDDKQLAGKIAEGDSKKCTSVKDMQDIGMRCFNEDPVNPQTRNYYYCGASGQLMGEKDYANPCGLVAKSLFNGIPYPDTFQLSIGYHPVRISNKGIAWESDLDYVFGDPDDPSKAWTDVGDGTCHVEHFAVWMRIAAFPTFRKLWGVIHSDLDKGNYTVTVRSNYDVSPWSGEKHIVVSTANRFGGRNLFIGIVYLCAAGVALLMLLAYVLRGLFGHKKEYDLNNLKWD